MAAMGAPERFEDVVASCTRADAERARWDVTFGVDDADAIAARAAELGGRVLTAPFDAPWVRMTVVADPSGAVFTARCAGRPEPIPPWRVPSARR